LSPAGAAAAEALNWPQQLAATLTAFYTKSIPPAAHEVFNLTCLQLCHVREQATAGARTAATQLQPQVLNNDGVRWSPVLSF